MLQFDAPGDLSMAITAFLIARAGELPEVTRDAMVQAQSQGAYQIFVRSLEALYGAGPAATPDGVQLCASLARFATITFAPLPGPEGYGAPDRAGKVLKACLRRLGELSEAEAPPEDDPAPLPQYVPAA